MVDEVPFHRTFQSRIGHLGLASTILLSSACASPVQSLWPPAPTEPSRTIVISVDAWHAVIALPLEPRTEGPGLRTERTPSDLEPQSSVLPSTSLGALRLSKGSPQHFYEEWGYAEQGWYLEDRRGISGVLRALFWPTAGVVEVTKSARVWAERTPDPPAETYRFMISEEGYHRLKRHLEGTIARREPVLTSGASTFYPAVRSYHLFHQCHQYAALALREAGLPVSPGWALTRGLFAAQLGRAERLVHDAPVARRPEPARRVTLTRANRITAPD